MKPKDTLEDGPSHLIESIIPLSEVPRFLPPEKYLIVRLNVGKILAPVKNLPVKLVQLPDPSWGEFSDAHAVLTGYQGMGRKDINDFQRFLAQMASEALGAQPASSGD